MDGACILAIYKRVLAKGEFPTDLEAQGVPSWSWPGWEIIARELGILTQGQSARLLFQFISLTEELQVQFAAGKTISEADMGKRTSILMRLAEALQASQQQDLDMTLGVTDEPIALQQHAAATNKGMRLPTPVGTTGQQQHKSQKPPKQHRQQSRLKPGPGKDEKRAQGRMGNAVRTAAQPLADKAALLNLSASQVQGLADELGALAQDEVLVNELPPQGMLLVDHLDRKSKDSLLHKPWVHNFCLEDEEETENGSPIRRRVWLTYDELLRRPDGQAILQDYQHPSYRSTKTPSNARPGQQRKLLNRGTNGIPRTPLTQATLDQEQERSPAHHHAKTRRDGKPDAAAAANAAEERQPRQPSQQHAERQQPPGQSGAAAIVSAGTASGLKPGPVPPGQATAADASLPAASAGRSHGPEQSQPAAQAQGGLFAKVPFLEVMVQSLRASGSAPDPAASPVDGKENQGRSLEQGLLAAAAKQEVLAGSEQQPSGVGAGKGVGGSGAAGQQDVLSVVQAPHVGSTGSPKAAGLCRTSRTHAWQSPCAAATEKRAASEAVRRVDTGVKKPRLYSSPLAKDSARKILGQRSNCSPSGTNLASGAALAFSPAGAAVSPTRSGLRQRVPASPPATSGGPALEGKLSGLAAGAGQLAAAVGRRQTSSKISASASQSRGTASPPTGAGRAAQLGSGGECDTLRNPLADRVKLFVRTTQLFERQEQQRQQQRQPGTQQPANAAAEQQQQQQATPSVYSDAMEVCEDNCERTGDVAARHAAAGNQGNQSEWQTGQGAHVPAAAPDSVEGGAGQGQTLYYSLPLAVDDPGGAEGMTEDQHTDATEEPAAEPNVRKAGQGEVAGGAAPGVAHGSAWTGEQAPTELLASGKTQRKGVGSVSQGRGGSTGVGDGSRAGGRAGGMLQLLSAPLSYLLGNRKAKGKGKGKAKQEAGKAADGGVGPEPGPAALPVTLEADAVVIARQVAPEPAKQAPAGGPEQQQLPQPSAVAEDATDERPCTDAQSAGASAADDTAVERQASGEAGANRGLPGIGEGQAGAIMGMEAAPVAGEGHEGAQKPDMPAAGQQQGAAPQPATELAEAQRDAAPAPAPAGAGPSGAGDAAPLPDCQTAAPGPSAAVGDGAGSTASGFAAGPGAALTETQDCWPSQVPLNLSRASGVSCAHDVVAAVHPLFQVSLATYWMQPMFQQPPNPPPRGEEILDEIRRVQAEGQADWAAQPARGGALASQGLEGAEVAQPVHNSAEGEAPYLTAPSPAPSQPSPSVQQGIAAGTAHGNLGGCGQLEPTMDQGAQPAAEIAAEPAFKGFFIPDSGQQPFTQAPSQTYF